MFLLEIFLKIRTVQYLKNGKIYVLKNMLLLRKLYFFSVNKIFTKENLKIIAILEIQSIIILQIFGRYFSVHNKNHPSDKNPNKIN